VGAATGGPCPLVFGTRRGREDGRSTGAASFSGDACSPTASSALRMRCISASDSTNGATGPVPGLRLSPGTRRGRDGTRLSSATASPRDVNDCAILARQVSTQRAANQPVRHVVNKQLLTACARYPTCPDLRSQSDMSLCSGYSSRLHPAGGEDQATGETEKVLRCSPASRLLQSGRFSTFGGQCSYLGVSANTEPSVVGLDGRGSRANPRGSQAGVNRPAGKRWDDGRAAPLTEPHW